jgi:lauroyl/myristoyl acyltransferase
VRQWLGYWTYRVLSGLLGLLPEPVVRRAGYRLGWLVSFIARDRFRMAVRHQRRVLGEGHDHRRQARRVFGWYGRYWAETFWLRPRRHKSIVDHSDIENIEILHEAVASGRGVILALPHMGNWEAAGLRASAEDARVLAVAEELGNERIVHWFISMRNMMNIDIVIARKGGQVTRALLERLKQGGVIALLADRDISGRGITVDFFGEETTIPAGPVALADRTGAVLLPVGTYFREGRGHHFVVTDPLEMEAGLDAEVRVADAAQRLAARLERIILRHPAQWHLIVPNWPSDRS